MKMLLLILIFIIPNAIHRDVFILYVQPVGETFTQEEQQYAMNNAIAAIDYWQELSPITTSVTIIGSAVITAPDDILDDPYGLIWDAHIPDGALPIIIIDNSESRRALYADTILGMGYPNVMFIVNEVGPDIYAHEFGHTLYGLTDKPDIYDIMDSFPMLAYDRHMIGCGSLAELGKPCTTIALPMVTR